jgi:hypothetical protein
MYYFQNLVLSLTDNFAGLFSHSSASGIKDKGWLLRATRTDNVLWRIDQFPANDRETNNKTPVVAKKQATIQL